MTNPAPSTSPAAPPAKPSQIPFLVVSLLLIIVGALIYMKLSAEPGGRRVNIALLTWNEDSFWDPVIQGAQDAAQEFNADLTIIKSKPQLEAQNQHLRDLLAKGIEGVAISPNDPRAQAELLKEVADKCAIVTMDIDAPESNRRVFVGIDNYSAGHVIADDVREAVPEGGEVIISVGSIEMPHGAQRRQGVIDGLLDRPYKPDGAMDPLDAKLAGSKYSVVATVIDHGDVARSTQLMSDALKAHPNAKCVVGLFSYSAGAALRALEQAGKAGQVKIIAFDETEETQAGIESGTIFSSILQDQYRMGNEAIRVLADEVRGTVHHGPTGPRKIILEVGYMRKDNIDSLRQRLAIRMPGSTPTTHPAQ